MERAPAEIQIRLIAREDLPGLEWDGKFIHFRRLFQDIYRRTRLGRALMWVAVAPPDHLVGQLFVQLTSVRMDLADGSQRAYMHAFRVRPSFRNAGLGSRLLHVVEEDLQARGFQTVTLNVAKDNQAALRFYRRYGYRIVGPEPGRWSYIDHLGHRREVHEPSWRMEKSLASLSSPDGHNGG